MTHRLAYTALWITLWPVLSIVCLTAGIGIACYLLIALIPPIWQFDWETR